MDHNPNFKNRINFAVKFQYQQLLSSSYMNMYNRSNSPTLIYNDKDTVRIGGYRNGEMQLLL